MENLEKCIVEFPSELIKLKYSAHAKARLIERTTGALIVAPSFIRLTKDNVKLTKVVNGKLKEALVRIRYKKDIWMFLAIVIPCGVVKTIFFRNVKKNTVKKKQKAIKEIPFHALALEEGRQWEDEKNVPRNMGGKEISGWKKLFRIIWNLFRW